MTGLKAGYIDEKIGSDGHKFVINRHQTNSDRLYLFDLYAVDLWAGYDAQRPLHEEIVQGFTLQPELVLGGGRVQIENRELQLYGESTRYGSVPKKFVEFFKESILQMYKQKYPQLESVCINVPEYSRNETKVTFLDEMVK